MVTRYPSTGEIEMAVSRSDAPNAALDDRREFYLRNSRETLVLESRESFGHFTA